MRHELVQRIAFACVGFMLGNLSSLHRTLHHEAASLQRPCPACAPNAAACAPSPKEAACPKATASPKAACAPCPKACPEAAPARQAGGVAVTVVGPRGKAPVILAQARLVAAALPRAWLGVDVYYRGGEASTPAVRDVLRGVRGVDRVGAVALPGALAAATQRALLLSAAFWRSLRASRVLWFEPGSTVLCGRSPPASRDDLREMDTRALAVGRRSASTRSTPTTGSARPGSGRSPARPTPAAATARCRCGTATRSSRF